jgi:hypothetical protein
VDAHRGYFGTTPLFEAHGFHPPIEAVERRYRFLRLFWGGVSFRAGAASRCIEVGHSHSSVAVGRQQAVSRQICAPDLEMVT